MIALITCAKTRTSRSPTLGTGCSSYIKVIHVWSEVPTSADNHGGRDFLQWKSLQGINLFTVSIKASLNSDQVDSHLSKPLPYQVAVNPRVPL